MRYRLSLAALSLLLAAPGCASPLNGARAAIGAVSELYTAAEPPLERRYATEQEDCLAVAAPAPCVAAVRAKWAPTRHAVEALYAAVVAGIAALHLAEAGEALGQGVDVAALAAVVARAVDAAEAFRQAVAAGQAVAQ